jgi:hypothetical protein
MHIGPKRILVIYANQDRPEETRKTISDHLHVLEHSDIEHELTYYNIFESSENCSGSYGNRKKFSDRLLKSDFDAVILHYSFLSSRTLGLYFYKWKRRFCWVNDLDCLKIAIPQDEGECSELLDEWLFEIGVSVIFSVHYAPDGPLYRIMRNYAAIYSCLPGYINEETAEEYRKSLRPIAEREKDIIYRARRLPAWYGSAGRLKHRIAEVVFTRARAQGFNVDISTRIEDSIMSSDWMEFLASGKAVLGTPGGWSIIDRRGEIKAQGQALLRENPNLSVEEVEVRMPRDWDRYTLFTVTPRHFEAVMTKTCQLLIEGEYKGVIQPNKHYIPLKQDFSNLDEALDKVRDHDYMQNIVDQAYEDICLSGKYTYRAFARRIEEVLAEHQRIHPSLRKSAMEKETVEEKFVILERQLIAERHQNALLYAMLPDLADEIANMAISALWKKAKAKLKKALPIVSIGLLGLILVLVLLLLF